VANRADQAFVDEVAATYEALGHNVLKDQEIGGYRADLVTTSHVGVQPIRQVVECLDAELSIPLRLLQRFLNAADTIRATGVVTTLTAVSRRGFSRAAEEAARAARIRLEEFDDLRARVRLTKQSSRDASPSIPSPFGQAPARPPLPLATAPSIRAQPNTAMATPISARRNEVFISYSHKDKRWFERLRVHLTPLERSGALHRWDDTMISPGNEWRKEIKAALVRARVVVIMVSADFLASDFIATDELPPILKAAEQDGAVILPLIVSPSQFQRTPQLSRYQSVNDPSRPLIKMSKTQREETLVNLAVRISDLLQSGAA
jgi:hypothetical protein